ncbi:MAG: hypothetical protein ACFFG0_03520 [Candidatus Thorarchaeota archaeon]
MRKTKKKIKYSESFKRDYKFYKQNCNKFQFWGGELEQTNIKITKGCYSVQKCFYLWDTEGKKKLKCKDVDRLKKLINCKKAINFQIKQWSEGWDIPDTIKEYMSSFKSPPEWVEKSLRRAIKKNAKWELLFEQRRLK